MAQIVQLSSNEKFYGGNLFIMDNCSKKTQLPTEKDIEAAGNSAEMCSQMAVQTAAVVLCRAPDQESGLSAVQEGPQEEFAEKEISRPNGDRLEFRPLSDAERNDTYSFVDLI